MIEIITVKQRKERNAFIDLPNKVIYQNDASYVAKLNLDVKSQLSSKHPFFEYGKMEMFLAKKNNTYVGRIAAILNPTYNEHHNTAPTGFFGFYECIDDQEVANRLFDTAKNWLIEQGIKVIQGPVSPSSNYEFGFQTSGFEHRQVILSSHTAPYYHQQAEQYGFVPVKTLYAYKFKQADVAQKEKLQRAATIVRQRSKLVVRPLNMKDFKNEVAKVRAIYNEAWQPNWGHVPFSEKEFDLLANDLKLIAEPSLLLMGEIDNKVVGAAIAVPDYNIILRSMKGKLLPFNWIKLLTQKKKINWARVIILGVLPPYQKRGIDAVFYYELQKAAEQLGLAYGEGSWILEDNKMIIKGMQAAGGEIYKAYKVYELAI